MTKWLGIQARKNWPLSERLAFRTGAPDAKGCTLWTAYKNAHGYGVMTWQKRLQLAHRMAWVNANGPIPDGMEVCHSCDVPACVNVAHLFVGTHKDNMADRQAKGRTRPGRGTRHWSAKLIEAQVRAIRHDTRMGTEIAREYGVGSSIVYAIKARQKWAHLPD